MRVKFDLEYPLVCSPKVLFSRLSTPEGLGEWFAEKVDSDRDMFIFNWNKTEVKAKLVAFKENKLVRFQWDEISGEDNNYFEFGINLDEMTGSVSLFITDFAEEEDIRDSIDLWNQQISDLKRLLGS